MPFNISTTIVLAFLILLCPRATRAQNVLDKAGLTGSTLSTVAYSMRQLSTAYTGKALQVRRSSDNTVQDISFTVNGDVDTASLKSFVGAGNGFVSVWYDQSGNGRDLTQVINSNQPSLVIGGVIVRENGRPFIAFYGVSSGTINSLDLAADITTVGHVSAVHRFAVSGDGFILGHTGSYYWHSSPGTFLLASSLTSASILGGLGWSNGAPSTPVSISWPSGLTINELAPSSPSVGTTWNTLGKDRIFHQTTGGGGYSEVIIFPTMLPKSSRNYLEFGQASYFSILATLPLNWLGFTAQFQESNVLLKWQTATEQNSKEFIIQHSSDGLSFKNIGLLPASGNSNTVKSYSYLDANPVNGYNYYRLLQTDLDGKGSYSIVTKIKSTNDKAGFTVLGNPVTKGQLKIQLEKPLLLSLYNADGRLIWKRQYAEGIQVINVDSYKKGMYLLKANGHMEKILME